MVHMPPQAALAHTDWTAEDPDPLINAAVGEIRDDVTQYIAKKTRYSIADALHEIPEVAMRERVPTARILASKHKSFADLRKTFEGFGVTEANVQTALYIANKNPERAIGAIDAMPFASLKSKEGFLREAMDLLRLLDRFSKMDISKTAELKAVIESIFFQMHQAGFTQYPRSFESLLDGDVVDDTKVSAITNIGHLVEECKADLNLKTLEEYGKDLKEVEEKLKKLHEEGVTGVSAPEAVRAVYQAYFGSTDGGGFSPGKAKDAADQLYAENEIGALEAEVADKAIDMSLGFGPAKRNGNLLLPTKDYLKGWALGSSRSYIKHIAESIGVGGVFRPAWDEIAGDYPKLFIAYHALRESIKREYLPDTKEVRCELKDVSLLMLKAKARDVVHVREHHEFSKGNGDTLNEAKILRQGHERLMRYDFVRSALFSEVGDIPDDHYGKEYYREGIERSITYAQAQTGKWRRRLGTAAYAPVKYLVVKPVAAIARGTIGVVKFGGGVAAKGIAAPFRWAKHGLSRLNHYLFHEESTLFGGSGGGHH